MSRVYAEPAGWRGLTIVCDYCGFQETGHYFGWWISAEHGDMCWKCRTRPIPEPLRTGPERGEKP